jgi:hypothetical protein
MWPPFSWFTYTRSQLNTIVANQALILANQAVQGKFIMTTATQAVQGKFIMATATQVAALTAAVATLTSSFATLGTAIQSEIAALQAALSSAGVDDPAVDAAIANITQLSTTAATDASNLAASLPPAPGP